MKSPDHGALLLSGSWPAVIQAAETAQFTKGRFLRSRAKLLPKQLAPRASSITTLWDDALCAKSSSKPLRSPPGSSDGYLWERKPVPASLSKDKKPDQISANVTFQVILGDARRPQPSPGCEPFPVAWEAQRRRGASLEGSLLRVCVGETGKFYPFSAVL